MRPVTVVVCFIFFLSTPSLGLSDTDLNLENISKRNISEGAHRHLKMSACKLWWCFSSQGGLRLLVLEAGRLPLYFLCLASFAA